MLFPLEAMTTIKLSADDLAALRNGAIIERAGGPTIKIMLETTAFNCFCHTQGFAGDITQHRCCPPQP